MVIYVTQDGAHMARRSVVGLGMAALLTGGVVMPSPSVSASGYPLSYVQTGYIADPNLDFASWDVDGDVMAVGSVTSVQGGNTFGKVTVYTKPAAGWSAVGAPVATLVPSDGAQNPGFGVSVAVSGDTIVVGARDVGVSLGNPGFDGAAYVFEEPPGGWSGTVTESAKLVRGDGTGFKLGGSVAVSGDTVVVSGAVVECGRDAEDPSKCDPFVPNKNGSTANVYVKPDNGWEGVVTATATFAPIDDFGGSVTVATDGTTVAMAENLTSRAWLWERSSGGWTDTTQPVTLRPPVNVAYYGIDMAFDGEYFAIGSPVPFARNNGPGHIYIYKRTASGWPTDPIAELAAPTASPGVLDAFGASLELQDGRLATSTIEGPEELDGQQVSRGTMYVFDEPEGGWGTGTPAFTSFTAESSAGRWPATGLVQMSGKDLIADAHAGGNVLGGFYTFEARSDTTPPTVTPLVFGTLGNDGWYTSNVSVTWTVSDDESAVTDQTGCDAQTVNSDTSGVTFTCSATSTGGATSQSVTIKRDATPPTLDAQVNPNPVILGGSATASAGAADAMSGIASAECFPTYLDTSTIGTFTASCTVQDRAGWIEFDQTTYNVAAFFGAWNSPVPKSTLLKSASNIPVKFTLRNADGVITGTAARQLVANNQLRAVLTGPGSDTTIRAQSTSCAWDATTRLFKCSLKTPKGLLAGSAKTDTNPYLITVQERAAGTTDWLTAPGGTTANPNPVKVYFK